MPVEKIGRGWRARRKKGDKTFNGRIRDTEAAANEDAQQLEEAAAVCIERLKEVHAGFSMVLVVSCLLLPWFSMVAVGRSV